MDRFNKTIQVKPQSGYHQEQFDIYGRQERADGGRERDRDRDRDRRGGRDRDRRERKVEEPAGSGEPAEASAGTAAPAGDEKP
jgi:ribonuclease G